MKATAVLGWVLVSLFTSHAQEPSKYILSIVGGVYSGERSLVAVKCQPLQRAPPTEKKVGVAGMSAHTHNA